MPEKIGAMTLADVAPLERAKDPLQQALELLPHGGDVDESVLGTAFLVSPYAQFVLDWSGRILVCNRRAERSFRFDGDGPDADMRGRMFYMLTQMSRVVFEQHLRSAMASGTLIAPMKSHLGKQASNGSVFRVSLLRSASRGERLILLTQDQLKATAEALSNMNARRIEAREELARLGTAHMELQSTIASMEAFSRAASHDLKTPLNTLSMALELVDTHVATDFPDELKTYLAIMQKAVAQMDELTSDLLQHARSSAGLVSAEHVELRSATEEICRDLQTAFQSCGGRVHIHGDGFDIMAEPLLFRVLLSNLLSNAIKYRDPARPLSVDIHLIGDSWATGRLEVRDNGQGFAPEYAAEIFVPFRRLDNVQDGSGLGLSTCVEVCRRHGWDIGATSVPGESAVFTVDFAPDNRSAV